MHFISVLSAAVSVAAQPAPGAEAEILAVIRSMFEAAEKHDGALLQSLTFPEGHSTFTAIGEDGQQKITRRTWAESADATSRRKDTVEETMGKPEIRIRRDIASAWVPYRFKVNGKLSHCGINHFDLIRNDGQWRILNLTWTRETEGCEAG